MFLVSMRESIKQCPLTFSVLNDRGDIYAHISARNIIHLHHYLPFANLVARIQNFALIPSASTGKNTELRMCWPEYRSTR